VARTATSAVGNQRSTLGAGNHSRVLRDRLETLLSIAANRPVSYWLQFVETQVTVAIKHSLAVVLRTTFAMNAGNGIRPSGLPKSDRSADVCAISVGQFKPLLRLQGISGDAASSLQSWSCQVALLPSPVEFAKWRAPRPPQPSGFLRRCEAHFRPPI
jgi:hypothetical protein